MVNSVTVPSKIDFSIRYVLSDSIALPGKCSNRVIILVPLI